MKKFYMAHNYMGSQYSQGFANTWEVWVFSSKVARDDYIKNSLNITDKAISKSQVKDYADKPKPFSGQRRAIETRYSPNGKDIAGLLGTVGLFYNGEGVDL